MPHVDKYYVILFLKKREDFKRFLAWLLRLCSAHVDSDCYEVEQVYLPADTPVVIMSWVAGKANMPYLLNLYRKRSSYGSFRGAVTAFNRSKAHFFSPPNIPSPAFNSASTLLDSS